MKKQIVLAGLLAAMVCVATSVLVFPIPGGIEGYVHMGDAVIYLAAALLPTPYAVAAAAIGAGVADLMVAPIWAPFTIVIKAVMVLAFTSKKDTLMCRRNAVAPLLGGVVCVAGYYATEVVLLCWDMPFGVAAGAALAPVPFNLAQAVAGGVCFAVLALALDRMSIKQRLHKM